MKPAFPPRLLFLFLDMFLILFAIIIVTLITYLSLKPLIDNLFYSVPHEPKYKSKY